MEEKALAAVAAGFDVQIKDVVIRPFGSGLINNTWLIDKPEDGAQCFLLQQINHRIFTNVDGLINNIVLVNGHIRE